MGRPAEGHRLLTPVISRLGRRQERAIWTGMKRYLEAQPQPGRDNYGTGTGRDRLDRRPDHRAGGGSVLLLISLALIAGGGTLVWADTEQIHSGYVTTTTATYSTRGYALASDAINLHGLGLFVDQVRIRITSSDPSRPLFAGIAATGDVERYLGGVSYTTVARTRRHRPSGHRGPGGSGRRAALGRAGPGHREPDPHLGGPGRRLDGGGDEHRRPSGPLRPGRGGDIGAGAAVAGR